MSATSASGTTNALQRMVVDHAMKARTLDLKNQNTKINSQNKWEPFLYRSNGEMAARFLMDLDPLSGAQCSLSCKHWHVFRTSNAVSRLLCDVHFKVFFTPPQNGQKKEGTYWNRYRALGEIYPNARRFAFQPPTTIDFSIPSTPIKGDSAPAMVAIAGSTPEFLVKSTQGSALSVDAVMASYTATEVVDEVTQARKLVHHSRAQLRNADNVCLFQGDHPGRITSMAASPFMPLLAVGMDDGSLVLWNIINSTKMGILPFQPVDVSKISQPIDPQLNLPPLTRAIVGIFFLNEYSLATGYQDGTMCSWKWDGDGIVKKMEFKPEAFRYPNSRFIQIFQSPDRSTAVIHGQVYKEPFNYNILIFRGKHQPTEEFDVGNDPAQGICFLSNTSMVIAFPTETPFHSRVGVLDLNTRQCVCLISDMPSVSALDLRFNDNVLVISSFTRNLQTGNRETFISLFDLKRKDFIRRNQAENLTALAMIPPSINDESVVIPTPPRNPSLVTIAERLSKKVFLYDFMSLGGQSFFCSDTTIPFKVKAPLTLASSFSASASASASASLTTPPREGTSHSSQSVSTKAAAATTNGSGGSAYALAQPSAAASLSSYQAASATVAYHRGSGVTRTSASASGSGSGSAHSAALATSNGAPQNSTVATPPAPPAYLKKKRKRGGDSKDNKAV